MADKKKKKSRFKKILKNLGKIAALGTAAYGASKLFGGRRKGGQEGNIGIGLRAPRVDDYNYTPKTYTPFDPDPGPTLAAKGGRIGAKKGGHVKSMGKAKRGGGVAKR